MHRRSRIMVWRTRRLLELDPRILPPGERRHHERAACGPESLVLDSAEDFRRRLRNTGKESHDPRTDRTAPVPPASPLKPFLVEKRDMNRREFIVSTVAAAVAAALAAPARTLEAGKRFCHGCGGPIWRGSRAYLLAPLGRDEQDDYCLSCLAAIREQQTDWEEYLDAFFGQARAAPCRSNRRAPCRPA